MPANGIVTQKVGKVAQSKSKGAAYVKEINEAMGVESLASMKPETQPVTNIGAHHKAAI